MIAVASAAQAEMEVRYGINKSSVHNVWLKISKGGIQLYHNLTNITNSIIFDSSHSKCSLDMILKYRIRDEKSAIFSIMQRLYHICNGNCHSDLKAVVTT